MSRQHVGTAARTADPRSVTGPTSVDDDRAQAEVTGVTLLVGVVAIVITVSGGLLLANYVDDATNEPPPVDLDVTVNETHVTLTHDGGGTLAVDGVTVVLRQAGHESRSDLSTWTLDGDDDRFEPAERATASHGFEAGAASVLVVRRSTGSLLLDERVRVQAGT